MHPGNAEWFGIAAAAASLYAANAKTIIPLRIAAIIANALALIYSFLHGTYPTVALNAILLPLNAIRLRDMRQLVRQIDDAMKGDLNADWLLPFTRPVKFKAGEFIMHRGEYATAAFYIAAGEVELVEMGAVFGKGTLLGEIGLVAPDGKRNMSVRCRTDVQAAKLDYDRFKELYFQNPQFGFRLLHLIVARMQSNQEVAAPATTT
jgi:CRP/FNR family transcriptional regulator, cyclic AMP receptor protein